MYIKFTLWPPVGHTTFGTAHILQKYGKEGKKLWSMRHVSEISWIYTYGRLAITFKTYGIVKLVAVIKLDPERQVSH